MTYRSFSYTHLSTATRSAWVAGIGVLLIALNLRIGISSASALLDVLRTQLGLGAAATAAMPAIPTLCFAVVGLFAARFARTFGAERTVLFALLALAAGLAVRGVAMTWALLAGTVLGMCGVALCNVLLPTLLRTHFSSRIALMTSAYTTVMALGSTLGAAVAVPLAEWAGSPTLGLAIWAIPAALAAGVWAFVRAPVNGSASSRETSGAYVSPWAMARTRLGVLVTAYFSLQALNCYAVIGWLPMLLSERGMSGAGAGGVLAVTQAVGIPATFLVLNFARSPARLRGTFVAISAAMIAGFLGLLLAPVVLPVAWAALIGFGFCSFPLVLAVIGNSGSSVAETTALSSLSQSVGYSLAALGPFAIGMLRSVSGDWTVPMTALLVTAIAQLVVGVALTVRR